MAALADDASKADVLVEHCVHPRARLLGGDSPLKARLLSTLTLVYAQLGEFERAIAAGREGLRLAQQIGSAEDIVRRYINGSQAIDYVGRIEEALALGMEGITAAERLGMGHAAGDQLRMQAGWRLLRMCRLQDAERIISGTASQHGGALSAVLRRSASTTSLRRSSCR
jgi:hypothetical protein